MAEPELTYDPKSYLEWWVPERDERDATGKVVGVKRTLKARVPFDEAVERMARRLHAITAMGWSRLFGYDRLVDDDRAALRADAVALLQAALGEGS